MPGLKSLAAGEYYAHRRNTFWWIMGKLFDFDSDADYSNRIKQLTAAGICVWDVLYDCDRKGSLDSDIRQDTEQPNDLPALLTAQPSLRLIGFNGAAAQAIFSRHFTSSPIVGSLVKTVRLPSTSPAHARIDKYAKLAKWRELLINE